jgi:hypothetical protein
MILSLFVCILFTSCKKKYIRTEKICEKHLFLEVYEKWSEIGVSYLTDSMNFKIYVGQYNFGSEFYRYECKNDTLFIFRYSDGSIKGVNVVETKIYSLSELEKQRKFEK